MPVNRIAKHLDTPPAPPADTRGRYEFVSEAVLRAVAAVTRLLDDDDPAVVLKAAKMILDVEKTRMRHGREVHGAPDPYREETRQMLGALPSKAIPVKLEYDDFDDDGGSEDLTPRPPLRPGEGVFKTDASPCDRVPSLVSFGGPVPSAEGPNHRCGLNTPSPSLERGPGGEVLKTTGDGTDDGPSEFQQWLRRFNAERLAGGLPAVLPPAG